MGGHNSKLTPEAEAMPPKIRPLLQRKYEEIKARIRARILKSLKTDAAPSKKKLLKPEDDIEQEDTYEFQSLQSSPDRNLTSLKVQTVLEKKSSQLAPVSVDHDEIRDQKNEEDKPDTSIKEHKEKESGKAAKVVPVYIGGVFALEQATDGEEENEDQEYMRSINYEMYPSSPSFRVYCQEETAFVKELEKETDKDASKHDNTSSRDEEKNHQKTPSANSSVDNIADNNGQETQTKKKARRRRMKNPFHMGGPADCSVKNLLNVRGCAGAGHGHDRATLLAEESASM